MNGLYIYCIRKKVGNKFSAKSIFSDQKAFLLPHKNLEAIVSEVPLTEFNSAQIQQKAQENLSWIKEKAQIHEAVIEKAMLYKNRLIPVIPMQFGTIFKSSRKLFQVIDSQYELYNRSLTYLKNKQEWSVKVYLKEQEALEVELKNNNEVIKNKEQEITAMPKGMAYFFENQLKDIISSEINKQIDKYKQSFYSKLKHYAEDAIKGKILNKEFTGKKEPMVLNAIYLVHEKNIHQFKNNVFQLNDQMTSKGFLYELSGPWPPYNFTRI